MWKIITALLIEILIITPALAQNRPIKEIIGNTDEGDEIILLVSTIHQAQEEGVVFQYVLQHENTSRVNYASTGSCSNGKVTGIPDFGEVNTGYQWHVFQQDNKEVDIVVKPTSVASKKLLDRICYYAQ